MQTEFITEKFEETKKLGKLLAGELRGGEVICLSGELGAGKTTFTQGLLEGLGAEKPYTSPTFVVMKEYEVRRKRKEERRKYKKELKNKDKLTSYFLLHTSCFVYHIDAYRINEKDLLELGWEEIISDQNNISIIEWADRVEKIIPARAIWIKFEWLDEKKRKIILGVKKHKFAKILKPC